VHGLQREQVAEGRAVLLVVGQLDLDGERRADRAYQHGQFVLFRHLALRTWGGRFEHARSGGG